MPKNKETLLEIINNANIAENQKQEAVDEMIALTGSDRAGDGGGNFAGDKGLCGRCRDDHG